MSNIPEPAKMDTPKVVCNDDVCTRLPASKGEIANGNVLTDYAKLEVIHHQNMDFKDCKSKSYGQNISLAGPWPATEVVKSQSLWTETPAVILVVRRLGCPFCRKICHEVSSRRAGSCFRQQTLGTKFRSLRLI